MPTTTMVGEEGNPIKSQENERSGEWRPFEDFSYLSLSSSSSSSSSPKKEIEKNIWRECFLPTTPPPPPLYSLPPASVERELLKDLLGVLVGVEGRRLVSREGEMEGVKVRLFDVLLGGGKEEGKEGEEGEEGEGREQVLLPYMEMVKRVSLLGTYYYFLSSFTSRFTHTSSFSSSFSSLPPPPCSATLQAFSSSLSSILHEYTTTVTHLEGLLLSTNFTLHQIWSYVHPFLDVFGL